MQEEQTPQVADFSRESVKKKVREMVLTNPATLYGTAMGIVGGVGFLMLDPTLIIPAVTLLLAGGGLAVGAGSFIVNFFFRGDAMESRYIAELREKLQEARRKVRDAIQRDLEELGDKIPGAEGIAGQGADQMKLAKQKNDTLKTLLEQKLSADELTSARFAGTAEQLYFSVLDNVRRITDLLRSVESIDVARIDRRLKEIFRRKSQNGDEGKEKAALEGQKGLRAEQLDRISMLLRENEEALTQFDRTTAAVASMETSKSRDASVGLETVMEDLRKLVKRTKDT